MSTPDTIRYRPIEHIAAQERGHLLLLHVDNADGAPTHTVALVLAPEEEQPPFEPSVGRPLPDWPELAIACVWSDSTPMCARRLMRDPHIVPHLCPICSPHV